MNKVGAKRISSRRVLALLLALVMTAAVFPTVVLSNPDYIDGYDMGGAMHFLVRHWHTVDPNTESSNAGSGDDGDNYEGNHFVVFEGYIKRLSATSHQLYIYQDGKLGLAPDDFMSNEYIQNWNRRNGTLEIVAVPAKDWDGTVIEEFAGFSLSTGRGAMNTDRGAAKLTVKYDAGCHLAKAHFFYKSILNVEGDNNEADWPKLSNGERDLEQDTKGTGKDKIYNTTEGLHTDKTASVHEELVNGKYVETNDGRTFDLKLEAWHSEGNLADVGMVLDASGSMAFTAGNPTAINVNALLASNNLSAANKTALTNKKNASTANWTNKLLTKEQVNLILDTNKTDNTQLGESGYSYYVYDSRSTNMEFAALGYVNNIVGGASEVQIAYGTNGSKIGAMDTSNSKRYYAGAGWYYVNHTANWSANYFDNSIQSGKSYIGMRYANGTGSYKDWIDLPPGYENSGLPGKGTGATYDKPADGDANMLPLQFYIDTDGYLRVFFATTSNSADAYVCSYVYEYSDNDYTKAEALQRALGAFTTTLLDKSPNSRVSATRFSVGTYNPSSTTNVMPATDLDKLVMLDWTSDPLEAAGILSLKRGTDANGGTYGTGIGGTRAGTPSTTYGVDQYNYGLTGQTSTRAGMQSFINKLLPNDNDNHDKFMIVFTDGLDTDYRDGYPDAIALANQLRREGYKIYAVMLTGGPVIEGGDQYTKAVTYLNQIADNSGMVYITDVIKKKYGYTESVDALQHIFTDEILPDILHRLKDYNVQDYIDPRFDLVDHRGRLWQLNAKGEVVITNADGSTHGTFDLKTGTPTNLGSGVTRRAIADGNKWYLEIDLTDRKTIDESSQKARLYYDETNDMYKLVWVNQNIPGTPVGEAKPNIWSSIVTVRAKDDFLGGNAVLTNGNGAGQNYVYSPKDSDANSGTSDMKKSAGDDYPSKGFPRTTVNVGFKSAGNATSDRIYMGEDIESFYDTFKNWIKNDNSSLYWDYLERYAKHLASENGTDLDDELKAIVKDLIEAGKKGEDYTVPYYYLEDNDDDGKATNQSGGQAANDLHEGDLMGYITYSFKEKNEGDFSGPTKDTDPRSATLSAEYKPLTYDERQHNVYEEDGGTVDESYNHTLVHGTGETDYDWNSTFKPTEGEEFDPKNGETKSEGDYDVSIVAGEIVLKMVAKDKNGKKVNEVIKDKLNPGDKITYSADLYREYNGVKQKVGTYTATYTVKSDGVLTYERADIKLDSDFEYMYTYGLPLGTYTLEPNANTKTGTPYLGFTKEIKFIEVKDWTSEDQGLFTNNELVTDTNPPEEDNHTGNYQENAKEYPAVPGNGNGTAHLGGSDKDDPDKAYLDELYALFEVYLVPVDPGKVEVQKQIIRDTTDPTFNKNTDEFEFTIELDASGIDTIFDVEYVTVAGDVAKISWIDNGNGTYTGTFKLRHNQVATISGIPSGVKYKIKETGKGKYELEGIKHNGEDYSGDTAEGIIDYAADGWAWEFDNAPPKESGVIEVTKVVDKSGIPTTAKFPFSITFKLPIGFDIKDVKDAENKSITGYVENADGTYTYTFDLADGETFKLNVPVGTTYTITETATGDYTLRSVAGDGTISSNKVASGDISKKDETDKWTFTNYKEKDFGAIGVTKIVDESGIPTDESFRFSITLKLPYGYSIEDVDDIGWVKNADGSYTATVDIAHGNTFRLSKIPVGATYTITETDPKGYTLKDVTGDGTVNNKVASGTVTEKDQTYSWTFTNYKDKEFGSIKVKKIVSGVKTDASFPFEITLTLPLGYSIDDVQAASGSNITGWTNKGDRTYTATFSLAHDGTFELSKVPVGTSYTIKETDSKGYTVTVNDQSSDTASGIVANKAQTYSWTFNNAKEGSIEIEKVVTGAVDAESEFDFTVTLDMSAVETDFDIDNVTVSGAAIRWTDNGDGTYTGIFKLKHNEKVNISGLPVGTEYTIEETITGDKYTLHGVVSHKTDKDGEVITEEDSDKPVQAGTTNKGVGSGSVEQDITHHWEYENAPPDLGAIEITKTVEGADEDDSDYNDEEFEFTVTLDASAIETGFDISKVVVSGEVTSIDWSDPDNDGIYTGTFSLKHGKTVKISNLPAGVTYTVTESQIAGEYTLQGIESHKTNIDGTITEETEPGSGIYENVPAGTVGNDIGSGEVEKDVTHHWEFTNSLRPKKGSLEVGKIVTGNRADPDKEFGFTVKLTAPEGKELDPDELEISGLTEEEYSWVKDEATGEWSLSFKLKADQTVTISGILEGTKYTVEETDKNEYQLVEVNSSMTDEAGNPIEGEAGDIEVGFVVSGTIATETIHKWQFRNIPPFEFPSTGGKGVALSVIFGVLLLAASLVLRKKHMLVD
ncbi:MAG: VWA domain-containing protein [Oscillospiraceae bacterium]|nr:VWA domain-containing protein [Oscillospiraceae bacterium]